MTIPTNSVRSDTSRGLTCSAGVRPNVANSLGSEDKPAVGLIGSSVPVELVLAAGCLPARVSARMEDSGMPSDPMEEGHEDEVKSLFRQALSGAFDHLDLLVIPSTSDGYRYLYQYLKEIQRQGKGDRIPPLVHYDFLYGPAASVRRHSFDSLVDLKRRFEMLSGVCASEASLKQAIGATNAIRRAAARISGLRFDRRVSGAVAHRALRTIELRAPDQAAQTLGTLVDEWSRADEAALTPRVLLISSVPLYHEKLHTALEAAGVLVVAEDEQWSRNTEIQSDGPLLEAIFQYYLENSVSPRMLQAQREAWYREQVLQKQCEGIIFYVPPDDQFFGWRYPALNSLATSQGLPTLLIRDDVLQPNAADAICDLVRAFADTIHQSKETRE